MSVSLTHQFIYPYQISTAKFLCSFCGCCLVLIDLECQDDPCKVCVVAHCEFSANRGPRAVRYIRRKDRDLHGISNFPKLYYPELYLMKGGYLEFYSQFPELCEPPGHLPMIHPIWRDSCKRWTKETRKQWGLLKRRGARPIRD